MRTRVLIGALVVSASAWLGCTCEQRTGQRSGKLELPTLAGRERTGVDFGSVLVSLDAQVARSI